MAVGQVSFKDNKKVHYTFFTFPGSSHTKKRQVKRIIVPQRENPIVNRLNKTKVEKFPDLGMEREEKLKALRKKDQASKLERVSHFILFTSRMGKLFRGILGTFTDNFHRRKKRQELHRSERRRSGKRNMLMMSCLLGMMILRKRIISIRMVMIQMTLCKAALWGFWSLLFLY